MSTSDSSPGEFCTLTWVTCSHVLLLVCCVRPRLEIGAAERQALDTEEAKVFINLKLRLYPTLEAPHFDLVYVDVSLGALGQATNFESLFPDSHLFIKKTRVCEL